MTKSTTRVAADLETFTQTEITAKDVVAKAGRKNLIINGGFDVWQRGVTGSQANQAAYISADRWLTYIDISSTVYLSKVAFALGQTDVEGNPESYAKFDWLGTGSTALKVIEQRVENVIPVSGAPITLSFYARTEQADDVEIRFIQDNGVGGSAQVSITGGTVDCTTSWKKFTKTITLPSLAGKTVNAGSYLKVGFWSQGTLNSHLELANVQLELGSVATDFEHRSYGEELALCQRYYQRVTGKFTSQGTRWVGEYFGSYYMPVTMRSAPAFLGSRPAMLKAFGAGASLDSTAVVAGEAGISSIELQMTGGSVGTSAFLRFGASTDWFSLDAEL